MNRSRKVILDPIPFAIAVQRAAARLVPSKQRASGGVLCSAGATSAFLAAKVKPRAAAAQASHEWARGGFVLFLF
jgi:hypothetical protein